jgi:hypothetical protein
MDWQHWVHKTQDEDRHIKHTHTIRPTAHSHMSPTFRPTLKAPLPVSDILTTGYIDLCSCPLPLIFMLLHL